MELNQVHNKLVGSTREKHREPQIEYSSSETLQMETEDGDIESKGILFLQLVLI